MFVIEGKKNFMQDDLISIIIPIYNKEEYLERCVKSAMEQTYSNIEIVLVDDGSEDESPKMCDHYKELDRRVVVVHKKNGGLSDARNAGIDVSKGRYLFFLDADDYLALDAMEILHKRITEEKADIAICNFAWIGSKGESLCRDDVICDEVLDQQELLKKLMGKPNFYYVIACNKLYKRKIFDNCRFKLGKTHEDEFIVHHVFGLCHKAVSVSNILYYYIQSVNSITTSNISIKKLDYIEAMYERIQYFKKNKQMECAVKTAGLMWWACSELYTEIDIDEENKCRMHELKKCYDEVLPYILKNHVKSLKDLAGSIIFWASPSVYKKIKNIKRNK